MDLRGGGNERIHSVNGAPARLAASHQPSPLIGDRSIDSGDSTFESRRQDVPQPFVEPPAPGAGGQALEPGGKLAKRYNAQEPFVLISLGEPLDDTRVGSWSGPLGDDVR